MKIKCASHLYELLNPETLKERIASAVTLLSKHEFDAVAFRGLSGALVAPSIALAMGKTMIAVRKDGENCHSNHHVEGDHGAEKYVIIDDFISSGKTCREIVQKIYGVNPSAICIGVCEVLYAHHDDAKLKKVNVTVKKKTKDNVGQGPITVDVDPFEPTPVTASIETVKATIPEIDPQVFYGEGTVAVLRAQAGLPTESSPEVIRAKQALAFTSQYLPAIYQTGLFTKAPIAEEIIAYFGSTTLTR